MLPVNPNAVASWTAAALCRFTTSVLTATSSRIPSIGKKIHPFSSGVADFSLPAELRLRSVHARMVRLVLFDIDGTLVHTGGAGMKAFRRVFATEFGAADGFERLKFAGRTDVSLVREFFSHHHIPPTPQNFARFFERYVFWLDHILTQSHTQACPGIWEMHRRVARFARTAAVRFAHR